MLLNGRALHSLITELLAQAETRSNSSQMESTSLVPPVKESSNDAEIALACLHLKYSYSLLRCLWSEFFMLWN